MYVKTLKNYRYVPSTNYTPERESHASETRTILIVASIFYRQIRKFIESYRDIKPGYLPSIHWPDPFVYPERLGSLTGVSCLACNIRVSHTESEGMMPFVT